MRRLVLIAATLLALAGSAQSAQAAGWGPSFGVSLPASTSSQIRSSSVIPREGGGFIYVWADSAAATAGVKTRVAYPDGRVGPIRTIAPGFFFSIPIFAAAAGEGDENRVAFAFQEKGCSACQFSYKLLAGKLDSDGLLVGDPQMLQQVGPSAWDAIRQPSLSVAPDGSALIAWVFEQSSSDLLNLGVAAPGGDFTVGFLNPDDTTFNLPSAAARNGGGGFVAFSSNSGGAAMSGVMVSPEGVPSEPKTMGSGTNGDNTRSVIDSTGKATVVFTQYVDPHTRIYMRQMGADGEPIGADATQITDSGDLGFYEGSIALGPDDSVAVGMTEFTPSTSTTFPVAKKISPEGVVGAKQTLSDPLVESAGPQVAFDGSGPIAFVTEADVPDGEKRILVQRLDQDLAPSGQPSVIADYELGDYIYFGPPAFTDDGDGSIAWTASLSDISFAQQLDAATYDATGPDLDLWIPPAATKDLEVVMGSEASDRNGPVTFEWEFGDGGTATGAYVKHTFASVGEISVKITATDAVGNETSRTAQVNVVAAPDPDPDPPEPAIPPDTQITVKPGKKVKAKTATFKFTSSLTGSKFECRLDKAGWTDCKPPKKLKKLKPGKHTFKVRAIKGDLIDQTPASYDWTVKKAKKPRP